MDGILHGGGMDEQPCSRATRSWQPPRPFLPRWDPRRRLHACDGCGARCQCGRASLTKGIYGVDIGTSAEGAVYP